MLTWSLFLIVSVVFWLIVDVNRKGRLRLLGKGRWFFLGLGSQHYRWCQGHSVPFGIGVVASGTLAWVLPKREGAS